MVAKVDHHVAPNRPNTLTVQPRMTALGIDTATRLDKGPDWWADFFEIWRSRRAADGGTAPAFVGRYFGHGHPWVSGELARLSARVPAAWSIRHVVPFNEPGGSRVEGRSDDGSTPLAPATIHARGRHDGERTGRAIKAATRQQMDLKAPSAGALLVFLDVEPQTTLNPHYWMGWSEGVSQFKAGFRLLPGLYCVRKSDHRFDANDALAPLVENAFEQDNAAGWDRAKHRCYAVATPSPFNYPDLNAALEATEDRIPTMWPRFEDLEQPGGVRAPVVLWQHRINIVMTAAVRWTAKGAGPRVESRGTPNADYRFEVRIRKGGRVGIATFDYSLFGGGHWSNQIAVAPQFEIPGSGVTLLFPDEPYSEGTSYRGTATKELVDGNVTANFDNPSKVRDIDISVTSPDGYLGRPVTDFMLRRADASEDFLEIE
jgi:hypothetical protein